jgi:hypothetical protein
MIDEMLGIGNGPAHRIVALNSFYSPAPKPFAVSSLYALAAVVLITKTGPGFTKTFTG